MKIAEFTDSFYPSCDGVINVVVNYTTELNKLGHTVKVVAPKYPKKTGYKDNFPFEVYRYNHTLPALQGYRNVIPMFYGKLLKFMKEEQFDLIHVHSPFGMGKLAIKLGRKLHIPVVATLHTKYYDDILRVVHFKWLAKFGLHWLVMPT